MHLPQGILTMAEYWPVSPWGKKRQSAEGAERASAMLEESSQFCFDRGGGALSNKVLVVPAIPLLL